MQLKTADSITMYYIENKSNDFRFKQTFSSPKTHNSLEMQHKTVENEPIDTILLFILTKNQRFLTF